MIQDLLGNSYHISWNNTNVTTRRLVNDAYITTSQRTIAAPSGPKRIVVGTLNFQGLDSVQIYYDGALETGYEATQIPVNGSWMSIRGVTAGESADNLVVATTFAEANNGGCQELKPNGPNGLMMMGIGG